MSNSLIKGSEKSSVRGTYSETESLDNIDIKAFLFQPISPYVTLGNLKGDGYKVLFL